MIPEMQLKVAGRVMAASFRPLDGRIEAGLAELSGGPQGKAQWLIASLTEQLSADGRALATASLTVGEFDAALAHLYRALYGHQVPCEACCTVCGEGFEFTLDLDSMQSALAAETAGFEVADGVVTDRQSGRRFRLPTLGDLATLDRDGAEAWLRELLLEGAFAPHLEDEIARATPVLTQDVAAPCPECGAKNRVRFDLARYLVQSVEGEAAFLWREVHLIAERYGWSLDEILSLTRPVRRQLAGLIVSERSAVRLAS